VNYFEQPKLVHFREGVINRAIIGPASPLRNGSSDFGADRYLSCVIGRNFSRFSPSVQVPWRWVSIGCSPPVFAPNSLHSFSSRWKSSLRSCGR
jgi:hypothetical protein